MSKKPVLSLGTAQLGLHYGIANYKGKLDFHEVLTMLDVAWDLLAENFSKEEVGVKKAIMDKYWKGK